MAINLKLDAKIRAQSRDSIGQFMLLGADGQRQLQVWEVWPQNNHLKNHIEIAQHAANCYPQNVPSYHEDDETCARKSTQSQNGAIPLPRLTKFEPTEGGAQRYVAPTPPDATTTIRDQLG